MARKTPRARSDAPAGVPDRFHPAVRRWFGDQFEAPTAAERGGDPEVERRLVRRDVPPVLRQYVARSG